MTEEEKQEVIDEYNAAMFASNEAGYAGITAEQTIRYLMERVKESESKLAELDNQKPYGYVHKSIYESCGSCALSNEHDTYRGSRSHIPLFTHAVPAVDLTNLVPGASSMIPVSDYNTGQRDGWNACRAEILRKLKENI